MVLGVQACIYSLKFCSMSGKVSAKLDEINGLRKEVFLRKERVNLSCFTAWFDLSSFVLTCRVICVKIPVCK